MEQDDELREARGPVQAVCGEHELAFSRRNRHLRVPVLPEVIRAGFRDGRQPDGHSGPLHAREP